VDAIMRRHDKDEHIPAFKGQKWVSVSPGQRCIQRVARLLAGMGQGSSPGEEGSGGDHQALGACCSVIGVRNYENLDGAPCKISWAQALAGEHGSKYTVDVGGKGNLKLLDGRTSEPLSELEDNDISGDGTALLTAVHDLLDSHNVSYGDAVLGMTGKWRDGSASQHPNAAEVLATMRSSAGGFAHAGLVSEDMERQWEHSSARMAAAEVLRWPELSSVEVSALPIMTMGSGSSTTQVGLSGAWPACTAETTEAASFQGVTVGFGMHIKPPAEVVPSATLAHLEKSFASAGEASKTLCCEAGVVSDCEMSTAELELREAFAVFDHDSSGKLDKTEFRTVLMTSTAGGKPLSESEVDRTFAIVDSNSDGSVDVEEWIDWWRKHSSI
jgi:hypothetical protein